MKTLRRATSSNKNGLLPWRAQEMHTQAGRGVHAEGGRTRATTSSCSRRSSATIVSDAQVPFHAALNHDGQLTGQWGIHSRFETGAVRALPRQAEGRRPGPLVAGRQRARLRVRHAHRELPIRPDDPRRRQGRRRRTRRLRRRVFRGVLREGRADPRARLADSITAVASMIAERVGASWQPPLPLGRAAHAAEGPASVGALSLVAAFPAPFRRSMNFSIGWSTSRTASVTPVAMNAR